MNAYVRAVPASYARATRADPGVCDPDPRLARAQHAAYVRGLWDLGFTVTWIPPADALPDSVFVEDTAVISGGRALLTRTANPQRQGEGGPVAEALAAAGLEVVWLADGTLDGGDVLEVGGVLFVGRTARTDARGVAGLREAFAPLGRVVREVALPPGVLHLKCVCSAPADDVVLATDSLALELPPGVRRVGIPEEEAYAANTVGARGRVLIARGFPATERAVRAAGLEPVPLDLSEIQRGDGALTCLSLRDYRLGSA